MNILQEFYIDFICPTFRTLKNVDRSEYHKSLKQNLHIGHSLTKVETSQRNHIFLSVCSFIKLEKLRINYKTNHFAIKEKIYIEALKTAFQKFKGLEMKLKCA